MFLYSKLVQESGTASVMVRFFINTTAQSKRDWLSASDLVELPLAVSSCS